MWKKLSLLVAFVGILSVPGLAEEHKQSLVVLGLHGSLQPFFYTTKESVGLAASGESPIKISLELMEQIKYEIAFDLSRVLLRKGIVPGDEFDMDKFISEATITLQREEDYLLALIIGKQVIPIGHDVMRSLFRPLSENMSENEEDEHKLDGVLGFTVKVVDMPILDYLVDELELFLFESSTLDFSINDKIGISMSTQRSFQIIDAQTTLSVSYLTRSFNEINSEQRISFGVVQEVPFPFLETLLWAEAMYLKNYLNLSQTGWKFSVGTISRILNNFYLSAGLSKNSRQNSYGVGLYMRASKDLPLNKMTAGVEYRYTDYYDLSKQDSGALSVLFQFSLDMDVGVRRDRDY